MNFSEKKTIVFIAGAFVSHSVWNDWLSVFQNAGYKVYSPWWPRKDAPAEVMIRKHPDFDLGRLGLQELIESFELYLSGLTTKPLIVAEGLAAIPIKVLLHKNLISGAILLNPWPSNGFIPYRRHVLSLFFNIVISLRFRSSYLMTQRLWQKLFAFGRTFKEDRLSRYMVPESRRLILDAVLGCRTDYKGINVPILVVCTKYPVVSLSRQIKEFKKFRLASTPPELKIFPQYGPPAMGYGPDEEITAYLLDWISKIGADEDV